MSEEEGTIHAIPGNVYAPKPSPASADRDPDGPAVPAATNRRKRKRRRSTRPSKPNVSNEKPDDPDGVPHVDIRAAGIQIERPHRNNSEIPAVFISQIALRPASAPENLA